MQSHLNLTKKELAHIKTLVEYYKTYQWKSILEEPPEEGIYLVRHFQKPNICIRYFEKRATTANKWKCAMLITHWLPIPPILVDEK